MTLSPVAVFIPPPVITSERRGRSTAMGAALPPDRPVIAVVAADAVVDFFGDVGPSNVQ